MELHIQDGKAQMVGLSGDADTAYRAAPALDAGDIFRAHTQASKRRRETSHIEARVEPSFAVMN